MTPTFLICTFFSIRGKPNLKGDINVSYSKLKLLGYTEYKRYVFMELSVGLQTANIKSLDELNYTELYYMMSCIDTILFFGVTQLFKVLGCMLSQSFSNSCFSL